MTPPRVQRAPASVAVAWLAALAAAPVAAGQAPRAAATPGAPEPSVQLGTTVLPETVTVGDPFIVRVRVRAPRGATITFPAGPDSGASVEATDPRVVREAADSSLVDQVAGYRLVAWDTGSVSTALADVAVGGSVRQSISLADVRVYVRSVLPPDTALHVPKPARDILASEPPWWRLLALALGLLALLMLLLWWLWRRRRRRPAAGVRVDPFEAAVRELDRIEAMGLVEAGERSRFVALVVEVLRDYLAARVSGAQPSLTSTELLQALALSGEVPVARLAPVLAESDLVKFARRPVTAQRARELAREVREIAGEVEAAARARAAAAAQQAKAA